MMRIAFTIIFNGLHHLLHHDYYKFLLSNFDYWIVVEGASLNRGSTDWCNTMPPEYHKNGASVDGTREFLQNLTPNKKLKLFLSNGMWNSKDAQVNIAAQQINELTKEAFVWEIDIDEQWNVKDLETAERYLKENNAKTGCFLCDYFVGPNLIVKGVWGEGMLFPYRRLWHWKNDSFKTHEPPCLSNGNGLGILIPVRFKHYAFMFEKDVQFKDKWYSGHQGIYENWKKIQSETCFPQHISKLLGTNTHWGCTDTYIYKT